MGGLGGKAGGRGTVEVVEVHVTIVSVVVEADDVLLTAEDEAAAPTLLLVSLASLLLPSLLS